MVLDHTVKVVVDSQFGQLLTNECVVKHTVTLRNYVHLGIISAFGAALHGVGGAIEAGGAEANYMIGEAAYDCMKTGEFKPHRHF